MDFLGISHAKVLFTKEKRVRRKHFGEEVISAIPQHSRKEGDGWG